jgi:hypothetical protein
MALCLYGIGKTHTMIEKHIINGRNVWVEVQQQPANRSNPNTIPTEYFTARYYLEEPGATEGNWLMDHDGQPRLFESPVAALNYASKKIMERGA